jgi:hypothetical protein
MLRAIVLLLLLANLGFWAWTQGQLDGVVGVRAQGDREPERLARQVRADSVHILPAGATSAPPGGPGEPALACLEAGPYTPAQIAACATSCRRSGWSTWASTRTAKACRRRKTSSSG